MRRPVDTLQRSEVRVTAAIAITPIEIHKTRLLESAHFRILQHSAVFGTLGVNL
jgi:hypothetical protein